MNSLTAGVYSGIPMSRYCADELCLSPTLSSGCANTLLTCSPFHAWVSHPRSPIRIPRDESTPMDVGSIVHAILLEGDESGIAVIDADDYRTKAAQQARDAARAAGKHPILAAKMTDIRNMVGEARMYLESSELCGILDRGEAEATMIFLADDVWCRARPDWICGDKRWLLHVKTTGGSANPGVWIRSQMMNQGYDLAAAFYEIGAHELGMRKAESVFLVIETNEPYGCSLVGMDPAMRDFARRKAWRAISLWGHCLERDEWPCYPPHIAYAEPPAWAVAQFDEEELRAEIDPVQEREGLQA